MTTLYLCYQSLLDPLTCSQVVAYLEGLARAGYRPILVTFEPRRLTASECEHWDRSLSDLGITCAGFGTTSGRQSLRPRLTSPAASRWGCG